MWKKIHIRQLLEKIDEIFNMIKYLFDDVKKKSNVIVTINTPWHNPKRAKSRRLGIPHKKAKISFLR
jgi:hypothetical protein